MGVHRQSVSRWARELEQSGVRGLRKAPTYRSAGQVGARPTGRARTQRSSGDPRRSDTPADCGPPGGVRDLIEHQTGVRYHEDHVWRILRKLDWSCQRPTGRAMERDEQAIRHWKKYRWPQIKKKPCAKGVRSSSSTKAD